MKKKRVSLFLDLCVAFFMVLAISCSEDTHVHSWDSGVVTKEATHTTEGVMTYTCVICGETKTEPIEAIGHKALETWSCDEDGTGHLVKYCDCGYSERVESAPNFDDLFWLQDDGLLYSLKVASCPESIILPERVVVDDSTIVISKINYRLFQNHEELLKITIPSTVTEIFSLAFAGCSNLREVDLPDPVVIHNYAFIDCSNLEVIRVPEDLPNKYTIFFGCTRLGGVIPKPQGSAGGYIFYDCDADNADGNTDGLTSAECGWRYLEAAPADLRVVNGVPTVDSSQPGYYDSPETYIFGLYRESDLAKDSFCLPQEDRIDEYNFSPLEDIDKGRSNTDALVACMGSKTYSDHGGPEKTSNYAARLCDVLEYTNDGISFDDWFLPSIGQLSILNSFYVYTLKGDFENNYVSSSEEYTSPEACYVRIFLRDGGYKEIELRSSNFAVRPIRAFL